MRNVTVFFRSEERGSAEAALRHLGVHHGTLERGVEFDDAVYTANGNVVELIRGNVAFVVPMRNILMVRVFGDREVGGE